MAVVRRDLGALRTATRNRRHPRRKVHPPTAELKESLRRDAAGVGARRTPAYSGASPGARPALAHPRYAPRLRNAPGGAGADACGRGSTVADGPRRADDRAAGRRIGDGADCARAPRHGGAPLRPCSRASGAGSRRVAADAGAKGEGRLAAGGRTQGARLRGRGVRPPPPPHLPHHASRRPDGPGSRHRRRGAPLHRGVRPLDPARRVQLGPARPRLQAPDRRPAGHPGGRGRGPRLRRRRDRAGGAGASPRSRRCS